CQQNSNWSLTF
nr:immunoglobulin light chain junction region [Macaca mulatta]MOV85428.1 immunoglobulin light chain junction region [Macaca mulatta]